MAWAVVSCGLCTGLYVMMMASVSEWRMRRELAESEGVGLRAGIQEFDADRVGGAIAP